MLQGRRTRAGKWRLPGGMPGPCTRRQVLLNCTAPAFSREEIRIPECGKERGIVPDLREWCCPHIAVPDREVRAGSHITVGEYPAVGDTGQGSRVPRPGFVCPGSSAIRRNCGAQVGRMLRSLSRYRIRICRIRSSYSSGLRGLDLSCPPGWDGEEVAGSHGPQETSRGR